MKTTEYHVSKITVNNIEYEYVIGKSHTKIKGVGVFPNVDLGELHTVPEYCDCCGESLSVLYSDHVDKVKLMVAPADIAKKIKAHRGTMDDTFNALKK